MILFAPLSLGLPAVLSATDAQARSLSALSQPAARKEISRKRAIELARGHVTFKPKSIRAVKTTADKRPIWRITFSGESIGPARPMGEVTIVDLDRLSGEVVSISKS